ncbi:MAG: hydrogenase iron-sulfur subunit [Deltaproteobacteria bacterium]|jgi:coenzyme F420-reducing hydrogenase delta subunit|nr:MAG: hydrogenase iron-sulfur subunit [Deltaproteobacteria bacterium]
MTGEQKRTLALYYCQNVPASGERERQDLEEKYGGNIRLFPVPCSGRLEPIHLLLALEEFADVVYIITCPEGTCRYSEGNKRAKKRVEMTRTIIASIGLEVERIGMIIGSKENPISLADHARAAMERTLRLPPSPVHN